MMVDGNRLVICFRACVDRNASRRSDIAYVAQSLRRLRFSGLNVVKPTHPNYGNNHSAFCLLNSSHRITLFNTKA